ncbi:hypothetical protein ACLB2K_044273 [Fragaria x ananassa]
MGKMTSIESATAWGWALEALASSKHVAVSILHDLTAQIPPNLPADLRRSITERVALRCLEELSTAHDAPPVRRSEHSFDLSDSCEEVLKRVLNESAECDVRKEGGGRWKWDIESFTKHKRDRMPNSTLDKLKESIGDGSHPYAELLGRKSGLGSVAVAGSDGILRFNGGCSNAPNIGVREERNDENGLPSKRSRIELDTEKVVDENHEDDGLGVISKKTKRDASCALQSAEDNPVPLAGRQTLEHSLERDIPVPEGEGRVSEFQKEVTEERLVENPCADKSKDGSNGFSPEPTTSGVGPSHGAQHKVSAKDSSCNIEHEFHIEVRHPVSVGGSKQKSIVDEGGDKSEHLPEPTTLRVAPPDKARHKVFAKESVCNREHDSRIDITARASAEVSQKKNIANGAKDKSQLDYISMEKHKFLSSKCTLTRYCNSTEKDHCLMCNGGGQLLICSTSDCPLVYHESCMGSEFISYVSGDFYCPFCAYCLHLMECLEVEKEALRLRKDLYLFNCVLGSS